jgi:hypothetical protein
MKQKLGGLAMLAAVLITTGCASIDPAPEPSEEDNFLVFLLAGQSNMAGRGEVTAADREILPRIMMLAPDGSWQPAVDPIHYDKPRAGAGLGRSFAKVLTEQDEDITIGLVPAACGGSPISTWVPGGYHEQTESHPYDDAIVRTRRALQDGRLAGILWHQGESDSRPQRAAVYKENLAELIERFRRDLEASDVPFIIGQLGQFEAKPWTEARYQVNKAQIEVAAETAHAAFVSSDGLTAKEDNTHFNTPSLHEFGQRYAEAWLQVAGDQNSVD